MADNAAPRRDIIVIGASAGGVPVLLDFAAALPAQFPAAILVVQHVGAHPSVLPELLSQRGPNRALHPRSGQLLEPGTIFVAPPDHHMLVVDGAVRLTRDAKENHARPAIDPLFRSAAIARGPRVIGVILSGRLDDGTAGLQAIKACGGLAVVQDPEDSEETGMPASALAHVAVDHRITRATLAPTLMRLAGTPAPTVQPPPQRLLCEHHLSLGEGNAMELLDSIGTPSKIVCPDCSGVLWKLSDTDPVRYRCHTGHAFTEQTLAYTQGARLDEVLWSALRALQERETLLREMALTCRERGDDGEAAQWESQAEEVRSRTRQLETLATRE